MNGRVIVVLLDLSSTMTGLFLLFYNNVSCSVTRWRSGWCFALQPGNEAFNSR